MRIGEDEARFVIGLIMSVDRQKHIQRQADEETQGKREGNDIRESFPCARPTKRNSKQRKGKKKEEREGGEANQPVPRLQGRQPRTQHQREWDDPKQVSFLEVHWGDSTLILYRNYCLLASGYNFHRHERLSLVMVDIFYLY